MKFKTLFIVVICLIGLLSFAQTDREYQSLIAGAGLLHLQKDHDGAIEKYEKAFGIREPDALQAYKLAGAYALSKNQEMAFRYLNEALNNGWTEAQLLAFDPYFDYLKSNFPEKWAELTDKAQAKEMEYEKTLEYPKLRRRINQMTYEDQRLRIKRIQTKEGDTLQMLNRKIHETDARNLVRAKEILGEFGWPKISEIGKDGQHNLWLLVQHADRDIRFQSQVLAEMEKYKKTDGIDLEHYAFLYDRVRCNLNYKQLYGTQVNWIGNGRAKGFRPIIKEHKVNDRRRSLGLVPLEIYALNYGFDYKEVPTKIALEQDASDLAYTQKLMDSALISYKTQDYQKVYDYYNRASMVMGGLSNAENWEAAVLFAKIFNSTSEEQYRGISLDFLNLLYLRDELQSEKLFAQKEFKSFHDHPRWIRMTSLK